MPNEINIYTPRYMAEVVRSAPPLHTYFRDTFFTRREMFPTERIDFDLVKGDRRMAAFVHPKYGAEELRAEGYETKSYAPPLVSPSDITTADMLMTRMPGEDIYSGTTPADRAARKLVADYSRLNDAVTRREEWMCAQALLEGKIHIQGKGVDETIDYGFTNTKKLEGEAQWGKTEAKILDNLGDWVDDTLDNGFTSVDTCILGKKAARLIRDDPQIQKLLDNRRMDFGELSFRPTGGGVKYLGYLAEPGLNLYTYNECYLDDWSDPDAPVTHRIMPSNKIILINSATNFLMGYGMVTYLDDSQQWVTAQTDRLFRSYVQHKPDRRMIELSTRPLPVPDKVDSWLVAEICDAEEE